MRLLTLRNQPSSKANWFGSLSVFELGTLSFVLCSVSEPELLMSSSTPASQQSTKLKVRNTKFKTDGLLLNKLHRRAIHAVTQARRLRAVLKDVTEMRIATGTEDFSPRRK